MSLKGRFKTNSVENEHPEPDGFRHLGLNPAQNSSTGMGYFFGLRSKAKKPYAATAKANAAPACKRKLAVMPNEIKIWAPVSGRVQMARIGTKTSDHQARFLVPCQTAQIEPNETATEVMALYASLSIGLKVSNAIRTAKTRGISEKRLASNLLASQVFLGADDLSVTLEV